MRAEQKGSLDLFTTLGRMQPGYQFLVSRTHCRLMFSTVFTRTPRSSSAKLLSSWCLGLFLLRYRTLHLPLLPSHSHLFKCWMCDNTWLLSITQPKLMSCGHSDDQLGPATDSPEARLLSPSINYP